MERAQAYIESHDSKNKDSELCRIYMRRIEHLYYKVTRERERGGIEWRLLNGWKCVVM